METQILVQAVKEHIDSFGKRYDEWYVGISKNPVKRLVDQHNVNLSNRTLTYFEGKREASVREAEQQLIRMGLQGGTGGGDGTGNCKYIYTYMPSASTKE